MATTTTQPTLDQIAAAVGGKPSRDGRAIILSYGADGYLRIEPATVTAGGELVRCADGVTRPVGGTERPAARIVGQIARRNGATQQELRDRLRAAGIEVR